MDRGGLVDCGANERVGVSWSRFERHGYEKKFIGIINCSSNVFERVFVKVSNDFSSSQKSKVFVHSQSLYENLVAITHAHDP